MDHVSQDEASAEDRDGDGSRGYCRNHRNILVGAMHMKSKQCVDIMVLNESCTLKDCSRPMYRQARGSEPRLLTPGYRA